MDQYDRNQALRVADVSENLDIGSTRERVALWDLARDLHVDPHTDLTFLQALERAIELTHGG